ncbi:MAG TPA: SdpI family protein, partial [Acidimicrobiales bacterium]|nr:SdpI family protein [Acidimicrobiales bacterium]
RTGIANLARVLRALRLGLSGAIVFSVGRLAARGRLPRNVLVGIRIPSTLSSDEAWQAGHEAAAVALTAAGVLPVVLAVVDAATRPGPDAERALSRIGTGWLLAWIGVATVQARRAARATEAG